VLQVRLEHKDIQAKMVRQVKRVKLEHKVYVGNKVSKVLQGLKVQLVQEDRMAQLVRKVQLA
jgi:hypothetical protein